MRFAPDGLLPLVCAALTACTTPPPSATPPSDDSKVQRPLSGPDACSDAAIRLSVIETQPVRPSRALVCGEREVAAITQRCKQLAVRARALAARLETRERNVKLPSRPSADGRWLLEANDEDDPSGGFARLWAIDSGAPRLSFRAAIDGAWRFGPDAVLYGLERSGARGLFAFDPKTSTVHHFDDVHVFGFFEQTLVTRGKRWLQRFAPTSFEPMSRADVSALELDTDAPVVLAKGGSAFVSGALVSLTNGQILRRNVELTSVSAQGDRLLSCSRQDEQLEVIDAPSGKTLARFPTKGTEICQISQPVLAPDGLHAFGVESPANAQGLRNTVVVWTYDVASGGTKKLVDHSLGFGTSHGERASVQVGVEQRLCVAYGGMGWRMNGCPWVVARDGSVSIRPERQPPARRLAGLKGTEISRATSTSGDRLAILHAVFTGKDPSSLQAEQLVITLYGPSSGQPLKSIPVLKGGFRAYPKILDPGDAATPKPELKFVGDRLITFELGGIFADDDARPNMVDLEANQVSEVEHVPVELNRRWARFDRELVDLKTGERFHLSPSDEAWRRARDLGDQCERQVDSIGNPPATNNARKTGRPAR